MELAFTISMVTNEIIRAKVSKFNHDKLIWVHVNLGYYTTKSTYKLVLANSSLIGRTQCGTNLETSTYIKD